MPVPPRGVARWAASPTRNVLPERNRSATCAAKVKLPIRSIRGSRPGSPEAVRIRSAMASRRQPARQAGAGLAHHAVEPAVAQAAGQQDALGLGMLDRVEPVAALPRDRPQGCVEQRGHGLDQVVGSVHGDPQGAPDGAVGPVGGHHVARVHGPVPAGVAQGDPHTVAAVVHAHDLGAQRHARSGQRTQVAQQHGLQVVLRDARRRGRADHRALLGRGDAQVLDGAGGLAERAAVPLLPLDVRAAGPDLLLQAPGAHQLHRAQGHHGRPGQARQLGPAFDQQGLDALAGEGDGGGQAGGTGSDDQDGHARRGLGRSTSAPSTRLRFIVIYTMEHSYVKR